MKTNFPAISLGKSSPTHNTVILSSYFEDKPAIVTYVDYVPFLYVNVASGDNLVTFDTTFGCNYQCNQNEDCVAFVYFLEKCYLKSINSIIVKSIDTISFLKVQPKRLYTPQIGLEYIGNDILYYFGTFHSCQQACDSLTGCVGYVIIQFYI